MQMNTKIVDPWLEYEFRKKEPRKLNLPSHIYSERINQMLDELDL